jgi:hypothetical protein
MRSRDRSERSKHDSLRDEPERWTGQTGEETDLRHVLLERPGPNDRTDQAEDQTDSSCEIDDRT